MNPIEIRCDECREKKPLETAFRKEHGVPRPVCKACEREWSRDREARVRMGLAEKMDARNIALWVGGGS